MKQRFLLSICIFLSVNVLSQQQDSSYTKQTLSQTDIQLLFSFYTQDGNHSAVTGGTGTEKLQVYAPEVRITETIDTIHKILFHAGVDVITSASTDNIDFYVSSASSKDARIHGSLGYSYLEKKTGIEAGASGNFSIESDYTSGGVSLWINWRDKMQTREAGFNFQMFFDDLRFGLLDEEIMRRSHLVYPEELRGTQWFDNYTRNSFNVTFNYMQVINKRMNWSIIPGFSYQQGLLSTPFHRVYFNDSTRTEKVEKLPSQRIKLPIATQLNVFIAKRWILRAYYRFYWDNFGIIANTLSLESSVKLSAFITLSPLIRFYHQTASSYFEPYAGHAVAEQYYTSDYDLSSFYSFQPGIGLRITPYYLFPNTVLVFNEISLRYSYYHRSDGLQAHILGPSFYIAT